jgi:CheY-like chemotaxis protein
MVTAGDRVEVRVSDTGSGIEPAFLPYVFERFRQADSTMARSVGGLGLGLFIARRLIEAQGGRISAQSDGPGRGATFTVSLPVASVASSVSSATAIPPTAAPPTGQTHPDATTATVPARTGEPVDAGRDPHDRPSRTQTLAGVRVLAVDDDRDAREVMTSALEATGAFVRTAASASDALHWLSRERFDVLLTDIAMPEQDGYDLLRAIRRQTGTSYADIPAAAVTASAGDGERARVLGAGFQLHVPKPVQPETLAATVAQLALVVGR